MAGLFFLLCVGHAVADYPLQGEFLAFGKNHAAPVPGFQWWVLLTMHALIHAGAVYVITQSLKLALLEMMVHWWIDYGKNAKWYSFLADQTLHIFCKLLWVEIFYLALA
jgi:hypothetical protein